MTMTVKWYGEKAKAKARTGAAGGLKKWADDLLSESQTLVPVSPNTGGGFLRDSGKAQIDVGAMQAAVSYDGPSDKPALPIWVHENLTMHHRTGRSKFLETPLFSGRPKGMNLLVSEIRRALGS